jgi:hypothetical protein
MDIVQMLRSPSIRSKSTVEAADEIERLRAALRQITDAPDHYPAGYFKQRAMYALIS